MAGPYFQNVAALAASASANSLSPALNSLFTSGAGVHIACVVSKNNDVHNCGTAGWTKIAQTNSGASFTASIWIAAQGAAAPTFTWVEAVACHAQLAYYPDPMAKVAPDVSISGTAGADSTGTHTSNGFNSDANNTLAIYIDACAINTALAAPAGWTENSDVGSATSNTRQVFGSKALATSGLSSGNISVVGGVADWVQFQIELRQDDTAGLFASEFDTLAFLEPPEGLSIPKVEAYAWLEADDLRMSKMEVYAWLEPIPLTRRVSLM
jgi:hypothetical protein